MVHCRGSRVKARLGRLRDALPGPGALFGARLGAPGSMS